MIIIWGFKTYVRLLGILTVTCGHCGNPAAQRFEEVVRKFTFFWIPLFPVSRKNHLTCTFCGVTNSVPQEQVEGLRRYCVAPGAGTSPSADRAPTAAAPMTAAPQSIEGTPYSSPRPDQHSSGPHS